MSLDIEALYVAEYDRLCNYLRKRVHGNDPDTAADMAAEVFLRAWEKRHLYRPLPGVKPSSWLYRVATNLLTDHYRHHGRIAFYRYGNVKSRVMHVGTDEHVDQIDVARVLSTYRTGHAGYPPDKHLAVIRARFWDGGTDAAVAERLGMTEMAVKKLRIRALANLRKMMEAA